MRAPRLQLKVRTCAALIAFLSIVLAYVGSYYRLRQSDIRDRALYGVPGFTYTPVSECCSKDREVSDRAIAKHQRLIFWYLPLNWIDRNVFGVHPRSSASGG